MEMIDRALIGIVLAEPRRSARWIRAWRIALGCTSRTSGGTFCYWLGGRRRSGCRVPSARRSSSACSGYGISTACTARPKRKPRPRRSRPRRPATKQQGSQKARRNRCPMLSCTASTHPLGYCSDPWLPLMDARLIRANGPWRCVSVLRCSQTAWSSVRTSSLALGLGNRYLLWGR
eukprot:scaffold2360_cov380-Prasinococcus_capsulatus_cf.AAC.21